MPIDKKWLKSAGAVFSMVLLFSHFATAGARAETQAKILHETSWAYVNYELFQENPIEDGIGTFTSNTIEVYAYREATSVPAFSPGKVKFEDGSTCSMELPQDGSQYWGSGSFANYTIYDTKGNILQTARIVSGEPFYLNELEPGLHQFTTSFYFSQYFSCMLNGKRIHGWADRYTGSVTSKYLEVKKIDQRLIFEPLTTVKIDSKFIRLNPAINSELDMTVTELTPDICLLNQGIIYLKQVGTCSFGYQQEGDLNYAPLEEEVTFEITATPPIPKTATIYCVKGKLTKKVTSLKPKCPSGYKKRSI